MGLGWAGLGWAGLGWDLIGGLSIQCGAAVGPFRPYGGSLLSWQKEPKPLAPAYGPTLRFGSPRYGTFQGHAAYDLLRQVYVSRLRLTPKVLRTAPTGASTRPAEVALCGA